MSQRTVVALTLLNLALLAWQIGAQTLAHAGRSQPPILRGSGLEIVDADGKLRLQFVVEPADPTYAWPDGHKGYPETAILRLATADGKPRIKLTTSEEGSGLMLLGSSDTTRSVLKADGERTTLELRNDERVRQVLAP